MITLKSLKTIELKKKDIKEICNLKNTFWKFGFDSNFLWFKKHIKKIDIHNLLYLRNELVGYTLLRNRSVFLNNNKKKYLYFDTLIIKKKFRNLKLSKILMTFNNEIIISKNKHSLLMCNFKLISFYKKFKWKVMSNKKIIILDHKIEGYKFMIFNFVRVNSIKNKYYLNK
tara:strand:+ start:147 stop:659 length:513 start_codon:yes stop_codon:yes gene_type:complete